MLVQMNWQPTPRQLRQFGVGCLVVPPLVAWFWGASFGWVGTVAVLGLLVAVAGWFLPSFLRPLFVLLSLIAMPIGLVVGELVLLALYFGLFLPIGLVFRILGRDALRQKMDASISSHWSKKAQPSSARSYYQQF